MTAAPVPAEADLGDFRFFPLIIDRLFGSAFHARATDAEWRAGVTLWLKSYHQHPAGSLPDDDVELCRLAELGRDLKMWRKIKPMAMHGWFLADDGRLYHNTVAEVVTEAWERKIAQRNRTEKARAARLLQGPREEKRRDIRASSLRSEGEVSPLLSVGIETWPAAPRQNGSDHPAGAAGPKIFDLREKGRAILGQSHASLLRRMRREVGDERVRDALAGVERIGADDPAALFLTLCRDEPAGELPGPKGPPPTPEQAWRD